MTHRIFSVSEITREIKLLIEESFPAMWVEGEISNYRPHYSGHQYFTLKDQKAQLSCVMWRSRASTISFPVEDGIKVRVFGYLRLYEKTGRYQLDLLRMEPAGLGDLQARFDQLKQKLHSEGLFDENQKQPIPKFPRKIGVITSPTGAAVQDIISVLQRRSPSTQIFVFGVKVQGSGAAFEISRAIEYFNQKEPVDVLIVGRGGGSLEDLWAFNEESVARTIYNSGIPVISAVGHEIDYTIADFVADKRAPTPSAAAEIAVPDENELIDYVNRLKTKLQERIQSNISSKRDRITGMAKGYAFRRPADLVREHASRIDDFAQRFFQNASVLISVKRDYLNSMERHLTALNPETVLNRGYAMVLKDDLPVQSVTQLKEKDDLQLRMRDGQVEGKVTGVHYDK